MAFLERLARWSKHRMRRLRILRAIQESLLAILARLECGVAFARVNPISYRALGAWIVVDMQCGSKVFEVGHGRRSAESSLAALNLEIGVAAVVLGVRLKSSRARVSELGLVS